jgi:RNA polymerase sigma-70 factor (ECF subfamily)
MMPDEPEVHALLALMLLTESRRPARLRDGELVLLADQDRSLWDERRQRAGLESLARARALQASAPPGAYLLQAEIAALHCAPQTSWELVAARYDELAALTGSPVVALNRAVAIGESQGPAAGLAATEELDLGGYQYFHSTRAELLRRLERPEEARSAYARALAIVRSEAERRFLERRLAELG